MSENDTGSQKPASHRPHAAGRPKMKSMYRKMLEGDPLTAEQTIVASQVVMAFIVFLGMISILLFSLQFDGAKMRAGVIGSALTTGGAASLTGALLGFLFGLPHSGQNVDTDGRGGNGASRTNTNVDQVSD